MWSPDGRSLLFLRKPTAKGYYPGIEFDVGDVFRLELATGRTRLVTRRAIPVSWGRDDRIVVLRPRTASGELVFAVTAMSPDGRGERVVGVTDEEDVNIGSYSARQPHRAALPTAGAPFAPRPERRSCLDRLRAFRTTLSAGSRAAAR